jgi:tRNA dimethylallyltransferase
MEVIRLTGKPFSAQKSQWSASASPVKKSELDGVSPHLIGFTREVADLRARIDARVDAMFARGLVEETRRLLEQGLAQNKTAMQALGYRQVMEHLHGEHSLAKTMELVKIKTRQFAKRQMTWFRRHGNCEWIELKPADSPESILNRRDWLRRA